jgi:iron(III) transport system permease protein
MSAFSGSAEGTRFSPPPKKRVPSGLPLKARNWRAYLLFLFLLVIFGIFLLWPIARVLQSAFFGKDGKFTLAFVAAVFRDHEFRRGLLNSAGIAVCVTLLSAIISIPLAVMSVRLDFRGKSLVGGLLLVPLILPPFVGAIGMRQILGRFGALTSVAHHLGMGQPGTPIDWMGSARVLGIILVETLSLYPILYLNVAASLANIDPALEQAAANLGASRWTIFRRITLPLIRPGLFAGGAIVLIWSFTELGTPFMFDYDHVTPVQIYNRITQVQANPLPYALVVVTLVVSLGLYAASKLSLNCRQEIAATKASIQSTTRRLTWVQSIPVLACFLIVIGLALLPHVAVILFSVSGIGAWYESVLPRVFTAQHYVHGLSHELVLPSIRNSIEYASLSVIADLIVGLAIAWMVVRTSVRFRGVLDGLAMLPLAVPGIVMSFGYLGIALQLQGRLPIKWQPLFDVQRNPTLLLVIAYAMRRLPYVVRAGVAGLEQTPVDLELAARNLGASGAMTLRRITIPLISANLIAGALLAFAFAMLEVSDSLILAQSTRHWPITKAIAELFQRLRDGPYVASALGVWAMMLLTLTILSANTLLGKKMGAIFRA